MNNGFICESANIETLDPAFADMPIVRERRDDVSSAACCRIRSASAAPTPRSCSSGWTRERSIQHSGKVRDDDGADARQARAGHGGRQRSLDRLGHRQNARRARREPRLHLSGRGAGPTREAAGRVGRLRSRAAVRRRGHRLGRRSVRSDRGAMGLARFSRPRHRVLRQERAEGPLRRHHAREFHAHHDDLLLLVHRGRPSALPR